MILFNSSFLCLDINTDCVHGMAVSVKNNQISETAVYTFETSDTIFGIKSVIDEMERKLKDRFTSAYITGDFGQSKFESKTIKYSWNNLHKITIEDIRKQISTIIKETDKDHYPLHIIPANYNNTISKFSKAPIGQIVQNLVSNFKAICYNKENIDKKISLIKQSHIQTNSFYDPAFLLSRLHSKKDANTLFIDLGTEFTTLSIWNSGCPIFFHKIEFGQKVAIKAIQDDFNLNYDEAKRLKNSAVNLFEEDVDRFTQADAMYGFSKSELNSCVVPFIYELIEKIQEHLSYFFEKHSVDEVFLFSDGAKINNVNLIFEKLFNCDIKTLGTYSVLEALHSYILSKQKAAIKTKESTGNFITKWLNKSKPQNRTSKKFFTPIFPSTLSFDMNSSLTYQLFNSGFISGIHVDIMDGFFVNHIRGGINQIKTIKKNSKAIAHVHLMTERPLTWGMEAITAGADIIILSAESDGAIDAFYKLKQSGKRIGFAIKPETPVSYLKKVIRDVDEVLILSVAPGSGGQQFIDTALNKIRTLYNTRKKYKLAFKISVDGGINEETAKLCWDAGCDYLVSGSYLEKSPDFAIGVQNLMPKNKSFY